jgi:hypothetical protein
MWYCRFLDLNSLTLYVYKIINPLYPLVMGVKEHDVG